MPRALNRQDRTAEALDEADFRASIADIFQRDERRKAMIAQVVVSRDRRDAENDNGSTTGTVASFYELCLRTEGPDGVLKFYNGPVAVGATQMQTGV
ncbi:hypothetical protein PHYPSEUDO_000612 [Phytophthora pseudosyringae]|uniref:Uncharacterized protein n=1 Tax=Phytophthora pseudosyringae TaxID=221518 RepID=A0A8T1V2Q7_9STRA|nr:hypothetical protein PHYPSEUDO_000612 [Phytophthora pseudosyringae]